MRFYTKTHRHCCGVDLHAKGLSLCILDAEVEVVLHRIVRAEPASLLHAVAAFRDDLDVAAECMFTWHRLAALCARECIPFVLGHALNMKAIHGGKAKSEAALRLRSRHDVRRRFELHRSVGRHIAAERALGFREDQLNPLLGEDDSHHG